MEKMSGMTSDHQEAVTGIRIVLNLAVKYLEFRVVF